MNCPPSSSQTGTAQTAATTTGIGVSPYLSYPLAASADPNTAAQQQYGYMLHNAKQLIRAGMYSQAATYLQRIMTGAPGTRIAAQAQRLLASLPT
jgi:hypothetical protein